MHPYLTYTSKMYFTENNTEDLCQKGYWLGNYNVGLSWKPQKYNKMHFDLSLYIKNLFGQKYLIDAGNAGDVIGFPTFVPGAPTTVGITLRLRYNK